MLILVLLVGVGGALGATARFAIQLFAQSQGWTPWGTFLANVVGCFLMGWLITLLEDVSWFREYGRYALVIGFLGAFTTFSAFSLDSLQLVEEGKLMAAAVYILATMFTCLLATWLGMKMVVSDA